MSMLVKISDMMKSKGLQCCGILDTLLDLLDDMPNTPKEFVTGMTECIVLVMTDVLRDLWSHAHITVEEFKEALFEMNFLLEVGDITRSP